MSDSESQVLFGTRVQPTVDLKGRYGLCIIALNLGVKYILFFKELIFSFLFYGWSSVIAVYLHHNMALSIPVAGFLVNFAFFISYTFSIIGVYFADTRLGFSFYSPHSNFY